MLKLNRRTEYALLSLRYLSQPDRGLASAREVAEKYALPENLLAKVLQILTQAGITRSLKGASGGYSLARRLETITLWEVLVLFNESLVLVGCIDAAATCECHLQTHCDIRPGMEALNRVLTAQFHGLYLNDFFDAHVTTTPVADTPRVARRTPLSIQRRTSDYSP